MVKWLLEHPGVFIWYDNPNSKDNLPKTPQSYTTGVYMPFGYGWSGVATWVEPYGQTNPCGPGGWTRSNLYY